MWMSEKNGFIYAVNNTKTFNLIRNLLFTIVKHLYNAINKGRKGRETEKLDTSKILLSALFDIESMDVFVRLLNTNIPK